MRHKGSKSFEFITRTGSIKLEGTYYHCGCSNSKTVSNIVSDGRKFSRQACELTSRYAASNSYQQASHFLRKDFGIWVSHEMLRTRILTLSGQIREIREHSGQELHWDKLAGQKLYGYADGVLIHIRKEGWKECKLLRFECENNRQVRHRGLLGTIERFGHMVRREAIHIGAKDAEEVVFLMDGAEGFHQHIQKQLPSARQIVDYWHACQHIADCAELLHHGKPKQLSDWRSKYCRMLREAGAGTLINHLRKSRAGLRDEQKAEAIDKLFGYLAGRAERMEYRQLLAAGYRIDSGPIESSCKNVIQARLKTSGMRWSRKGACQL